MRLFPPLVASRDGVRGEFRVRWSGFDRGGSGLRVFSVDFRENGPRGRTRRGADRRPLDTAWRSIRRGTSLRSVRFRGRPGHSYQFRLRAVDRAGNVSPFVSATTIVPFDERVRDVRFRGRWNVLRARPAYFGRFSASASRGASVAFAYRGEAIYLIARTGPRGGRALINFDRTRRVIDFYSPRVRYRTLIFKAKTLQGSHKFSLRVLRSRRRSSRGFEVGIDGIGVYRRGR